MRRRRRQVGVHQHLDADAPLLRGDERLGEAHVRDRVDRDLDLRRVVLRVRRAAQPLVRVRVTREAVAHRALDRADHLREQGALLALAAVGVVEQRPGRRCDVSRAVPDPRRRVVRLDAVQPSQPLGPAEGPDTAVVHRACVGAGTCAVHRDCSCPAVCGPAGSALRDGVRAMLRLRLGPAPGDVLGRGKRDDADAHPGPATSGCSTGRPAVTDPPDREVSDRVRLQLGSRDRGHPHLRAAVDLDPHGSRGRHDRGAGPADPLGHRITWQLAPGAKGGSGVRRVLRAVESTPPGRLPRGRPSLARRLRGRLGARFGERLRVRQGPRLRHGGRACRGTCVRRAPCLSHRPAGRACDRHTNP